MDLSYLNGLEWFVFFIRMIESTLLESYFNRVRFPASLMATSTRDTQTFVSRLVRKAKA